MSAPKPKRVSCEVPEPVNQALLEIAREQVVTRSQVIRRAIAEYLAKRGFTREF